jgi:hypothetical protein
MGDGYNPRDNVRQLRGKGGGTADYLDVKDRIRWFRHEHPNGLIVTEALKITDQVAIFKATATADMEGGVATGHGSETPGDFKDYIEKAETKAIGRALAALGYGTQFLPDDGEPIADAPVERSTPQTHQKPPEPPKSTRSGNVIPKDEQAALVGVSNSEADWITKINDATTAKQIDGVRVELTNANVISAPVWEAFGKKRQAINSTR